MSVFYPKKFKARIPSLFPIKSHLIELSKIVTLPRSDTVLPLLLSVDNLPEAARTDPTGF